MTFTVKDLRYHLEATLPDLYAFLRSRAERNLGQLGFDEVEVEIVVGHAIEILTKLGVLGTRDTVPETLLDRLAPAQFYKFLNQTVKRKSIDRLRKRRMLAYTFTELQMDRGVDEESDPLNEVTESLWGNTPFDTADKCALELASTQECRRLLEQCIEKLKKAPQQYQAIIQELREAGALELLEEVQATSSELLPETEPEHLSQQKDHAHKKLRRCIQGKSENLIDRIAFRLLEYGLRSPSADDISVELRTLAFNKEEQKVDLSEAEVRMGLRHLVSKGKLTWTGEEVVHFTSSQKKGLEHFYERE